MHTKLRIIQLSNIICVSNIIGENPHKPNWMQLADIKDLTLPFKPVRVVRILFPYILIHCINIMKTKDQIYLYKILHVGKFKLSEIISHVVNCRL